MVGEFYSVMKSNRALILLHLLAGGAVCRLLAAEARFVSLFSEDGAPKGWVVPTEWNKYHVLLKGSHLKVVLNGETIQDLNLDEQTQSVKRHNGADAPPVKDRPRKGHIGFQELSRGGEHVQIRNARIRVLN